MNIIKIIGRTLIFLWAAAIVIGGVSALSSAGVLNVSAGGPPNGGFARNSAIQTGAIAMPPSFDRGGGDHESEGFSLSGLTTVAKNLMQMSGLIVVVTLVTRAIKVVGKRRTMTVSVS
jgi:hypothetical protein